MTILAIKYLEPDYQQTVDCIKATGLPVVYVDRKPFGIGSLAEAINRGMRSIKDDYVWIVTNITFDHDVPTRLLNNIGNACAIHPVFNSDHPYLRQGEGVKPIPQCEFTAPLIKRSDWIDLDEAMPYWGHDLDFGYRQFKAGKIILCDYTTTIGHTYIRNRARLPVTIKRKTLRVRHDRPTMRRLEDKYGKDWRGITWHKSERMIGEFYNQVTALWSGQL